MGMGNQQRNQNQVYFDPSNGQYYTMGSGNFRGTRSLGFSNFGKNYLNGFGQNQQKSPINDLVTQAMSAQANPVSLAQLFPSMNAPTMGTPMTNYGGLLSQASPFGQGQFGAGRFLGGNSMGGTGMTSNAMNTMPQQNQAPNQSLPNMPPSNAYLNPSNITKGAFGYWSPYTNAGNAVWDKIIASAPNVSTRPAPPPNAFSELVNNSMAQVNAQRAGQSTVNNTR